MITSVKQVIEAAEKRGFVIVIDPGPPPMPRLRYENMENVKYFATDALLDLLKAWRVEIIEALTGGNHGC